MLKRIILTASLLFPLTLISQSDTDSQRVASPKPSPHPSVRTEKTDTLNGTIKEVTKGQLVRITLEIGEKSFDISLGPESFLREIGLSLAKGDSVAVKGSLNGEKKTMLANEITLDKQDYILRDEAGIPLWEGGGCWFQ